MDEIQIQFATRISLFNRRRIDDYLEYMRQPKSRRPPQTETLPYPKTIVEVMNEALALFFSEYPMQQRKGPDPTKLTKKENNQ